MEAHHHILLVAPDGCIQKNKRLIDFVNGICTNATRVSIVCPPQDVDNQEILSNLLHKLASVYEVPMNIKDAEFYDLSIYLGSSPTPLVQTMLSRFMDNGARRKFDDPINRMKVPRLVSSSTLNRALVPVDTTLRFLLRKIADDLFNRISKSRHDAAEKNQYWQHYQKRQLPQDLYNKYKNVLNLDCFSFNYFYFIKALIINQSHSIDAVYCYCNHQWCLPTGALLKELLGVTLFYYKDNVKSYKIKSSAADVVRLNEGWMLDLVDHFMNEEVNESGEKSFLAQKVVESETPCGVEQSTMLLTNVTQAGFYSAPAKRSVLFYGNSYYNFYYLSQALRRRGWDVITVSIQSPDTKDSLYYHGEDLNLYSPDSEVFQRNLQNLYEIAKQRYSLFHFANDGVMSFFPQYHTHKDDVPPDMEAWKKLGKKIAYTVSGCNSGTSKESVAEWSRQASNGKVVCDTCIFQDNSEVCSPERSLGWGRKIEKFCDVIFGEQLPALDFMALPNVVREPSTVCLDPLVWHPDISIPPELLLEKRPGEFLIYHAVGNYDLRTNQTGRNIKGTGAVLEAIERLKGEGFPVRLVFVTDKPSKEVRFTQVQADVVIDQLNYGRYGANARESMMLGKPTICYINPREPSPDRELQSIKEVPLVNADEDTLYEVLKKLLQDPDERAEIGRLSRNFALKWHSADACAERYEHIYDCLMEGKPITHPETWNFYDPVKINASSRQLSTI